MVERVGARSGPARSLLIEGDNLGVAAALWSGAWGEWVGAAGGARLLYLDPPYGMQADHTVALGVGEGGAAAREVAYRDTWASEGAYLQFMYERLAVMRPLLAEDGAVVVQCDWRSNSRLRLIMDELYGAACFRNEITWRRAPNLGRQAAARQLGRTVDTLLVYTRTAGSPMRGEPPMVTQAARLDAAGRPRRAKWDEARGEWFTTAPRGDYTDASVAALRAAGRIHDSPTGKVYVKYPLRRGRDGAWYKDQPVDTLWTDAGVPPLRHGPREELAIGYATQKPEGLLRRLIGWTTRAGDLVIDLFCGSGTTLAAAEGMGRRWIGCDVGRRAVHVAHTRMLDAVERTGGAFDLLRAVGAVDSDAVMGAARRASVRDSSRPEPSR